MLACDVANCERETAMSGLTVKTDRKWRDFKYGDEVPKRVLASQFGHLEDGEADDGFIHYRRRWYHLSDFMVPSNGSPLKSLGWQGYLNDTYFSGVAIEVSRDGEQYRIATFYS